MRFGAYAAVEITALSRLAPAVVLSPGCGSHCFGVLFERFLLRRYLQRDPIIGLLVTFGLAMVAEQAGSG